MSLSDPQTDQLRYGELTTTDRDDAIAQLRYGELTTTDRDDAIACDEKSHARLTTD